MEEQQAFQAGSNPDGSDPWYCSCYNDNDNELQQQAALPEDGDLGPSIVPDTFSQPPDDLLQKINDNLQDHRVLIVATANYGMRDHVYNWIESLKRTNEDKFLILCLDDKLYDHLVLTGYERNVATIPSTWLHQKIDAGFEEYYTQMYRVITHAKTLVVQQLLYLDINVLFSDVDIVWLKPRIREQLYMYLDMRSETHVVFQQEGSDQKNINSGFYIMRPSEKMKRLLAATIYFGDQNDKLTQQGALNKALGYLNLRLTSSDVILLDVLQWPNGWIYFSNNWTKSLGIEPYIVHANYLVGEDKKNKLRDDNFWYIDDAWLASIDEKATSLSSSSNSTSSSTNETTKA
ncbi:nucleotide-diphospho-sugar transferase-domain-containing protein [Absidia repens]|uniref:Nucleotide-diphospho-sugar transferase-domain-containing protein n=1 Tax=Absidia repens TaxID=90262 RepID=A0A1X2IM89_9FUNG|nr:nucleotide-diphospho-sugar transferase-domain-containing protein [Absidia repens]